MRRLIIISIIISIGVFHLIADKSARYELVEKMRIEGTGSGYILKNPGLMRVGQAGELYVNDDKQFLIFDKTGKFIRNLQKPGEGPGEFVYTVSYFPVKDGVIIISWSPRKCIYFNSNGDFIKEIKKKRGGFRSILGKKGNNYWYSETEGFTNNIKSGISKRTFKIYMTSFDKEDEKETGLQYLQRWGAQVTKTEKGRTAISLRSLDPFNNAFFNERRFFYNNSGEYTLTLVSPAEGKIIKEIRRDYERVKYTGKNNVRFQGWKREYFNDIMSLKIRDNLLWVMTSTVDKDKGVLVFRYSRDGDFKDQIWLKIPEVNSAEDLGKLNMQWSRDRIFAVSEDEDENSVIVEYKITKK